jgi:Fe-S-cluster containining protein
VGPIIRRRVYDTTVRIDTLSAHAENTGVNPSWYNEGLRFSCTKCGHCCGGAPGYVWVDVTEIDRLAAFLGLSRDDFARRYVRRVGRKYSLIEKVNYDCVFWEDGCKVYAARPTQCRTYPFWPEVIETEAAWNEESQSCPGIGRGKFYPIEAIERIRSGEDEAANRRR